MSRRLNHIVGKWLGERDHPGGEGASPTVTDEAVRYSSIQDVVNDFWAERGAVNRALTLP